MPWSPFGRKRWRWCWTSNQVWIILVLAWTNMKLSMQKFTRTMALYLFPYWRWRYLQDPRCFNCWIICGNAIWAGTSTIHSDARGPAGNGACCILVESLVSIPRCRSLICTLLLCSDGPFARQGTDWFWCAQAEKYENGVFGSCPRVYCVGCNVVPCGRVDIPGNDTVKLFCPNCNDIFVPPSSRFQGVDGTYLSAEVLTQ